MEKETRVGDSSFKLVWSRVNLFKWLYNHFRVQAQPPLTRFSHLILLYHFLNLGSTDRKDGRCGLRDPVQSATDRGPDEVWFSIPSGSLHAIVTIFESRLKLVLETVLKIAHLKNISNRRWICHRYFKKNLSSQYRAGYRSFLRVNLRHFIGRHNFTHFLLLNLHSPFVAFKGIL